MGFRGLGGPSAVYWTVVQHRDEDVDVKPAVSPGQQQEMLRHTGPIAKSAWCEGWGGIKKPPHKKKTLKIGPLKTRAL